MEEVDRQLRERMPADQIDAMRSALLALAPDGNLIRFGSPLEP